MIYQIENEYLSASISEFGATLTKLIDKKTGVDLVLGFDNEEDLIRNKDCFIGASVGRNCNRIGNAAFTLNGIKYDLTVNDNMNQLHGGDGFAHKMWKLIDKKDDELVLGLSSKDGEEGFPGNMEVQVSYKLDKNTLTWSYSGTTDKDTVFNMTNHSYFSLGDKNIFNQKLKVHTDKYSPTDEYCLTLKDAVDVTGTPYDFKEFTLFNDNLSKLDKGIDNNYVFEVMGDKLMAELTNDKLQLNVYSDLPDMHLYTSYNLHTDTSKDNRAYGKYDAVCLECQFYPNSINYDGYIKPILKKGETASHYIRYEVIEK